MGERDARLILVSDLGVLVKDAEDGSHDVFVQSIASGEPVAKRQSLGARQERTAGAVGDDRLGRRRAFRRIPRSHQRETPDRLYGFQGKDASYLPVDRRDRYLNFSRFDVGGVSDRSVGEKGLTAFLFSDRGLYSAGRGDSRRARRAPESWRNKVSGVPLQVEVTDSRGPGRQTRARQALRVGLRRNQTHHRRGRADRNLYGQCLRHQGRARRFAARLDDGKSP